MNLVTKHKETHRLRKQTYGCWGAEEGQLGGWGWVGTHYLKWITNQELLYSTQSSAQCYVAAWMGGEFEEALDTYVYMDKSLCYSPET